MKSMRERHKGITKYFPPLMREDARYNIPPPSMGGGKGEGEKVFSGE